MRRLFIACLLLAGCHRSLDVPMDLAADTDSSMQRDLATGNDLAMQPLPSDLAGLRHIGQECAQNADCISQRCITSTDWPDGPAGICGQACETTACAEGTCSDTSYGKWCLVPCNASPTCEQSLCCNASIQAECRPDDDCLL